MMLLVGLLLGLVGALIGWLARGFFSKIAVVRSYLIGFQDGATGNLGMLYRIPKDVRTPFGLNLEDYPELQEPTSCPTDNQSSNT